MIVRWPSKVSSALQHAYMGSEMKFAVAAILAISLSSCAVGQFDPSSSGASAVSQSQMNRTAGLEGVVDGIVGEAMESEHLPGVIVSVVRQGEVLLTKGYGTADIDGNLAVDGDTRFRIGSISKAVSALALTSLVEQGRIGLDDPVADYISGIENTGEFQEPLLIRHLLTHTAGFDQIGIGRQIGPLEAPFEARVEARPSLSEFLDGNLRRVRPSGLMFVYDTYAIVTIGRILERVTGKPYEAAMEELVFSPLEMDRTGIDLIGTKQDNNSVGYGWTQAAGFESVPYETYVTTPASSIDSTAVDMAKLLTALTSHDSALFDGKMAARVREEGFRPAPGFSGAGYGFWDVNFAVGDSHVPVRLHGGDMLGYHSLLLVEPSSRLGIFVSANRNSEAGGGPVAVQRKLAAALIERFAEVGKVARPTLKVSDRAADHTAYVGEYVNPVYCRSCSEDERARGAWRAQPGPVVTMVDGRLVLDGDTDLLRAEGHEGDVFVKADGSGALHFIRNSKGVVVAVSFRDDPITYERLVN